MSDVIKTIKSFAEMGFFRLARATGDLKEEQLDWRSCTEANSIRWILTHLNMELHVYLPRMLTGAAPTDWPEDYVGNEDYTLEKILKDLEDGKEQLYELLDASSEETLAKEVELFMGKRPLQFYITLMVSEIIHHEGQIAAILGVEKRIKGLE